jgi:uncharacterized protein YerC
MTRVSRRSIKKEVYDEIFNMLFEAIAGLSTKLSVASFFDEFLTPNEKLMFAKRLSVGLLIAEGFSYQDTMQLLKISTTTVSRYSSYYKYGKGYKQVIDKIKTKKEIRQYLLETAEIISSIGKIGGKGSGTWRGLHQEIIKNKSKLLR